MNQRYTISIEDSVIRVHTAGEFDFVNVFEMWEQIIEACESHNCLRVIGLSNLDEPPAQIESYEYLGMLEAVGLTPQHRVAWRTSFRCPLIDSCEPPKFDYNARINPRLIPF